MRPMPEPGSPIAGDPSTLGFERIRYERDARRGVATVTINRPDVLNALDFPTLREMARAFEQASWDDGVAVVVVTGAGDRSFCTGADLDEQAAMGATSGQYWRWMGAFIDMHDRLRHIGKPTIARINGICVGGGNELQMACDLSVLVDDAYIRHVGPEHGSVPAGGATQWLPLIVGDRRAREIVMLCEPIPPATALEWGLVSRVVPRAELDATRGGPGRQPGAEAARGDALHEDAAQLVARPRLVADGRARPRLAGGALRRRRDAGGGRRLPRQAEAALRRAPSTGGR